MKFIQKYKRNLGYKSDGQVNQRDERMFQTSQKTNVDSTYNVRIRFLNKTFFKYLPKQTLKGIYVLP